MFARVKPNKLMGDEGGHRFTVEALITDVIRRCRKHPVRPRFRSPKQKCDGNGRKGPSFVFAISACKPFRLEACKARRRTADACFGTVLNRGVYYCCKKAAAKRRAECQGGSLA